jgi:pimeloyl-ACP methyl ester carboxylesterase
MATEETTQRLVSALANAPTDVRVVPDSGHASNLDNPAFFTATLREFLVERVYPEGVADTTQAAGVDGEA